MKFNTKLAFTFITILILPIVLAVIAYITVGVTFLYSVRNSDSDSKFNFKIASDPVQAYTAVTADYYERIEEIAKEDASKLSDSTFLADIDDQLQEVSSFILVRKGEELYYNNSAKNGTELLARLPDYGKQGKDSVIGYYYSDLHYLVKKVDFLFEDDEPGSVFLITRVNMMLSESLLNNLMLAMVLVLLATSVLLTAWIRKSVFRPFGELNTAIQKITGGNLNDPLKTDEKGDVGELYDNFEKMRMQLKDTAEQKELSDIQSRELISNISHDLKTPITSIKGYVEGIMDGIADSPEKMDKYIRTIYNKANDMDRLIDELTVYSQIEGNKIPYNFHIINSTDYFDDCAEEVGLDLSARGIEFIYQNKVPEGTMIVADPEQLKRVINNIIHNSVKYSKKENGRITITVTEEDGVICVEIADNGKGIAKEDLKKIFERFYRTDASRNSQQGGSGIGLSIAKRIVEEHGGSIWATGENNQGVTIHFTLKKQEIEKDQPEENSGSNPIAKIEQIVKKTGKMIKDEATRSLENWSEEGREKIRNAENRDKNRNTDKSEKNRNAENLDVIQKAENGKEKSGPER